MGVLAGSTVVVTRERPGELGARLAALGADVLHVPMIETVPPPDGGHALDAALGGEPYDWIVVSSPTGARAVTGSRRGAPDDERTRFACVGEATAAVLVAGGHHVAFVPSAAHVDAIVAEFPGDRGRVLVARGDLAGTRLGDGLRDRGWTVDDVVAYATVERMPTESERDRAGRADVATLASGSAARAWVGAFGTALGVAVVSIGPFTTAEARRLGLDVAVTARVHSVDGLVDAVVAASAGVRR